MARLPHLCRRAPRLLAWALPLLLLTACDSTNTPDRELCSIGVGPEELDSPLLGIATYEVTYRVDATGDATIDLITFEDINGVRTQIESPVLPWARTVTLPAGANAGISVRGARAENAGIITSFSAESNEARNGAVDRLAQASSCGEP